MNPARCLIVAASLLFLGTGFAHADAVSHKWQGPFVGADFGAAYNTYNTDDTDQNISLSRITLNRTSVLPGLKAGYDWRFGSVVTGLQAGYQADLGAGVRHVNAPNALTAPNVHEAGNTTALLSFTGRAGLLASEQGLLYMRFGAVSAHTYQEQTDANRTQWRWDGWSWGILAGIGSEFALTEHLSLTGEFLHGFFVPKTVLAVSNNVNTTYAFSPAIDTFTAGLNYRF